MEGERAREQCLTSGSPLELSYHRCTYGLIPSLSLWLALLLSSSPALPRSLFFRSAEASRGPVAHALAHFVCLRLVFPRLNSINIYIGAEGVGSLSLSLSC